MKGIDPHQTAIEASMRTQKVAERLVGDILATRQGDMRVPRSQVGIEARREGGVGHALVELKEMRMPLADTDPDDFWPALRRESSNLAQWQEEGADMDVCETNPQFLFRFGLHAAEESKREMHLLGREPTDPAGVRIQPNERLRDRRRQVQTNE